MFTGALFTTAKRLNQPKCNTDGCVDKQNVVYIHMMQYYSAFKKKKKGHFNTSYNMDGPLRNYAEISQLKKDK